MDIKRVVLLSFLLFGLASAVAIFVSRELDVQKNVEYRMVTAIYTLTGATRKEVWEVENIETMTFGHRAFQYTSTWQINGRTEYLYMTGRITPVWGDYAFMSVEKQVVTDGLAEFLAELGVHIVLDRQMELADGNTSYIRLLKNDSAGMCFYHYDNNSLFCFGLR